MGVTRHDPGRALALSGLWLLAPVAPAGESIALEKARVVSASGTQDGVTLLIVDGRVAAIGAELPLPAGCERLDVSGLTVWPGFIDGFGELALDKESGLPLLPKSDGEAQDYGKAAFAETAEASRRGLRPELRARALLGAPNHDALDKLRFAGFTAQLLAPLEGLLPGQACLLELSDAPPRRAVIGEPGVLLLKYRSASGGGGGGRGRPRDDGEFGYPTTLMGALAHLRQAFLDARHLTRWQEAWSREQAGVERPPDDECLETLGLALNGKLRVAFLVDRENDIRRALALAQEFGLAPWIVGGKEAWKCAAELAATKTPVIASLAFPDAPERRGAKRKKTEAAAAATPAPVPAESAAVPATAPAEVAAVENAAKPVQEWEVEDALLAEPLELFEQREAAWIDEVENVERLLAAHVDVALSQRGSSGPSDFFADLRVALEHGLAADAAIAALTTTPARLFGSERELGSIRVGARANLIVVEGDLASKERAVRHVFIGSDHYVGPVKKKEAEAKKDASSGDPSQVGGATPPAAVTEPLDLTGTWQLKGDGANGFTATLTLKQEGGTLSGSLESEMGTAAISSGKLEGDAFALTISAEFQGRKFEFQLTGTATKESLTGKFATPFGEPSPFTARRPGLLDAHDHGEGCGCGAHPEDSR